MTKYTDVNKLVEEWIRNAYHNRIYLCSKYGRCVDYYSNSSSERYSYCSERGAKMDLKGEEVR